MKKNHTPKPHKSDYWLYGKHACFAALQNPKRIIKRILVSPHWHEQLPLLNTHPEAKHTPIKEIEPLLPPQSNHQGIAILTAPLRKIDIEDILPQSPLVVLDQVSDPHNLGAILRSAAAFGAKAVITTSNNAVSENATVAKIACGALETVPIIEVTNLARTLDDLKKEHYWCVGLDHRGKQALHTLSLPESVVLVLGAEGKGLRPLVAKKCDFTAFLPISSHMESLNVSNAAAIALYELYKQSA